MAESGSRNLIAALDEASLSGFHLRAVLVSGMGFFTDAYDLFVIGIVSTLISAQWHLSSGRLALLNSTMLAAAFVGALVFGRFADVAGRKIQSAQSQAEADSMARLAAEALALRPLRLAQECKQLRHIGPRPDLGRL